MYKNKGSEGIIIFSKVFESVIHPKDYIQLIKDLPYKAPAGIHFTKAEVDAILGENAASLLGIGKEG